MTDHKVLDDKIAGLVRSVEKGVPDGLEEKIRAAAGRHRSTGVRQEKNRLGWLPVLTGAAAAAALLAALLIGPALPKQPASQISEIRTQFELVDKNITIVFIQRPDFKLHLED